MSECEGLRTAEALELPSKCAACPDLLAFAQHYLGLGHAAFHLSEIGGEMVGESGQEFDERVAEHFPEELAGFISIAARQTLGEVLNTIDDNKQQVKDEAEALSRSCDGVLKMKAAKGDLEFIVALCASARAYVRDAEQPKEVTTNVWVRTKK